MIHVLLSNLKNPVPLTLMPLILSKPRIGTSMVFCLYFLVYYVNELLIHFTRFYVDVPPDSYILLTSLSRLKNFPLRTSNLTQTLIDLILELAQFLFFSRTIYVSFSRDFLYTTTNHS